MRSLMAKVLGLLWALQGAILIVEESIRAFVRMEPGPPYATAILLYSLLIVVGVLIAMRVRGWALIGSVAALYQGGSHFIYLTNIWPTLDVNTVFSMFVVTLALLTMLFVVVSLSQRAASQRASAP